MSGEKPVLTYFPSRGRMETIRLTLAAAGVDWVEAPPLSSKEELEKLRSDGVLLFQQVPLLQWGGLDVVQSGSIARHLARKLHMDGTTEEEKTKVDMLFEGAKDFGLPVASVGLVDDAEKQLQKVKQEIIPRYMPVYEKFLSESKSGYLVGASVTIADTALLEALLVLEEVYPHAFHSYPKQKEFLVRMKAMPSMAAYLHSPRRFPPVTKELMGKFLTILGMK